MNLSKATIKDQQRLAIAAGYLHGGFGISALLDWQAAVMQLAEQGLLRAMSLAYPAIDWQDVAITSTQRDAETRRVFDQQALFISSWQSRQQRWIQFATAAVTDGVWLPNMLALWPLPCPTGWYQQNDLVTASGRQCLIDDVGQPRMYQPANEQVGEIITEWSCYYVVTAGTNAPLSAKVLEWLAKPECVGWQVLLTEQEYDVEQVMAQVREVLSAWQSLPYPISTLPQK